LRPGITFTYLGVKVNEHAAVHFSASLSPNLFAAGEIRGRQRARSRLCRRRRHDDRYRIRPNCRRRSGGREPRTTAAALDALTREATALATGVAVRPERQREGSRASDAICNACRYCEGFCAVFPAMTRRLEFGRTDIHYLPTLP
jgi:hypothetical protein